MPKQAQKLALCLQFIAIELKFKAVSQMLVAIVYMYTYTYKYMYKKANKIYEQTLVLHMQALIKRQKGV